MIYDHYTDEWGRRLRPYEPMPASPWVLPMQPTPEETQRDLADIFRPKPPAITAAEIEEFRKLLDRAREYDKRNNEPECELDSKRQALKTLAAELGVEITFL